MPMNADALAELIETKMDALSDEEKADRKKTYKVFAAAVIEHIQAAASISGVAAGLAAPPGGGPVTGTLVVPPGSIL